MSNLNKLDFTALEISGRKYLKWVQDVKLHLTAKSLRVTIKEPTDDEPVHDALQTQYLAEEDPRTIWLVLANHFDHQKDIYLPEARNDCGNGQQAPPRAQGQQIRGSPKGGNLTRKRQLLTLKALNFKNKGKAIAQSTSTELDMCYHCGSKDHWSRVCRATPEAIAKYHSRREINFVHVEHPEDTTTTLEVLDFHEASTPMEE
ncbi:hypothetical protein EV2_006880 [Malus domestica]